MDVDKSAKKDMLSPSMITDYFGSSKPNGQQRKKKSAVKEDSPVSSVYLTPESSPGSHSNPESPAKETGEQEDGVGLNSKAILKAVAPTDGGLDTQVSSASSDGCAESIAKETGSKDMNHHCSSSSQLSIQADVSCSESLQSPKKCSRQEGKDESAPSGTNLSQTSSSPVIYAVQSCDSKTTSTSPCLPRLKLRKGANSKSQAATATTGKEGESLKPKPGRRKKKEPDAANNSFITDFFPVRRSGRQTKSEIEREKQHQLKQLILSGCEDGLEVKEFESKGRGVVATKNFAKGDFIVEYAGDLIDVAEAKEREEEYSKNPDIGCYMYYFKCGSKHYCVDATAESGKLGRLLNHSSKEGNCCTRSLEVEGVARLFLEAKRDICCGEELTYDYGDRSKASLALHPWLKL